MRFPYAAILFLLIGLGPVRAAGDGEEIARLVEQLGSRKFTEREEASKRLEQIGEPALEALAKALENNDLEVRTRAERILLAIQRERTIDFEIRRFEGHTDRITSVAVSPDGKWLLTAAEDDTVRVWEVASGKEQRQFGEKVKGVQSVTFSPDGRKALTAGRDKTIRLWDVATGTELKDFFNPLGIPYLAVFSPDGKRFATGSTRDAAIWDLASGKIIRRFDTQLGPARTVAFSPDGSRLLAAGNMKDRSLTIWDVETGNQLTDPFPSPSSACESSLLLSRSE